MLIDCETCTVRGEGCADCVVTVLLGAPPGWQTSDPSVVPFGRRPTHPGAVARAPEAEDRCTPDAPVRASVGGAVVHADPDPDPDDAAAGWALVDLDGVERQAVRALADFGLVPPLRHQDASPPGTDRRAGGDRHVS